MQQNSRHTYGTMNKDLAKSKYQPEIYYEGRNIYTTSENRQSTGAVKNRKGTTLIYTIPDINFQPLFNRYSYFADGRLRNYTTDLNLDSQFFPVRDQMIIGMEPLLDDLLIFTTDNRSSTPRSIGCVWRLTVRPKFELRLIYMNELDFSTQYPIEAEARYETETVAKTYFIDRYNEFRYLNVLDPDLPNTPLDLVNITPTFTPGNLSMIGTLPGGSFTAGMVGWAYSYSKFNGQETKISPLTKLYNANQFDNGNSVNETTSRSFQLEFNNVDTRFDVVNIYRVFYTSLNAEPQITIAAQEQIKSSTLRYVDDYSSIVKTLSTADFIINQADPFIPGTIASKNDYLFADDITYKQFDVDFDARAYRFGFQGDPNYPRICNIYDSSGNVEATIDGNSPVWPTDMELDAINPSNKADTRRNMQYYDGTNKGFIDDGTPGSGVENPDYKVYMYQKNGNVLGGSGPNIEYKFITPLNVPDSKGMLDSQINLSTEDSLLNPSKQTLTGFKRDEVYRLGIQFFNNRGQWSFVKWIGDIRMPEAIDGYPISVVSPTDTDYIAMVQLQLEITLLNPPTSRNDITGYRYVRVARSRFDKTCLAQGFFNPMGIINSQTAGGVDDNYIYVNRITPLVGVDSYLNAIGPFNNFNAGMYKVGGSNNGYSSFMYCRNANSDDETDDWNVRWESDAQDSNGGEAKVRYRPFLCQFETNEINQFTPDNGYYKIHGLSELTPASEDSQITDSTQPNAALSSFQATVLGYNDQADDNTALTFETWVKGGSTDVGIPIVIEPEDNKYIPEREGFKQKSLQRNNGTTRTFLASGAFVLRSSEFAAKVEVQNNKYFAFLASKPGAPEKNHGLDTALWYYGTLADPTDIRGLKRPSTSESKLIIGDYKQFLPNQYGGDTYSTRTRNNYVPASEYTPISQSVSTAWGDTWVGYSVFQHCEVQNKDDLSIRCSGRLVMQLPMEQEIRNDLIKSDFIRERVFNASFEETFNYNTVYSQDYDLNPQIPQPLNWQINQRFIAETAYSDPKLNGEQIDSWTVWRVGNRKPLDAKWGRVVGLVENRDILFFLQEQAVGYWEVQPYKQAVTTDGSAIEIGTGDVLARRMYITTNSGCQHKFSIGKSPFGIMYYDQYNKAIRILTNNVEELSLAKGLSVDLYNLQQFKDMPTHGDGITTEFDNDRSEMIMVFREPGGIVAELPDDPQGPTPATIDPQPNDRPATNYAVVYSFPKGGFSTLLDLQSRLLQKEADFVFAASNNGRELHTINTGKRGEFFGKVYESSVTIVMNAIPDVTKLLTNLRWNSEVYDEDGKPLHDIPISHVEVWNDHQTTGKVDVTSMDFNQFKRLMRNWLFKVPFDENDGMQRMRDQYFFVKLYIDNAPNYEHVIHDLVASFIPQPI